MVTRTVGARTPGDLSRAHAPTSTDWATGLERGSGLPKLHSISGGTGTRTLVLCISPRSPDSHYPQIHKLFLSSIHLPSTHGPLCFECWCLRGGTQLRGPITHLCRALETPTGGCFYKRLCGQAPSSSTIKFTLSV